MNTSGKHNGSALVISLIILLVLTVLGIQGMQSSVLEEKMAGNFQDRTLAFQAAEAALKFAESSLNNANTPPVIGSTISSIEVLDFQNRNFVDDTFWSGRSSGLNVTTISSWGLSAQPQIVIEQRDVTSGPSSVRGPEAGAQKKGSTSSSVYSYRITAKGVGKSPNSVVYLQSNFDKVYF